MDVCTALFEAESAPVVVGGRYGLGSKDVTPAQFLAVYANLTLDKPKNHFTLGIVDDVTNTSLEVGEEVNVTGDDGTISCKFWGLGADGTVGANKNSIRSLVTIQTNMHRHTSAMTPKNPVVLHSLTCVSVIHPSDLHIW